MIWLITNQYLFKRLLVGFGCIGGDTPNIVSDQATFSDKHQVYFDQQVLL